MQRWLLFLVCIIGMAFAGTLIAKERPMVRKYNQVTKTWGTYPLTSIHDIQFRSQADLLQADALQGTHACIPWQTSLMEGDTVVVRGIVIVPSAAKWPNHGIIYTQHGWNLLLHDQTNQNEWAGLFVRVGSTSDTAQCDLDGFNNISRGDLVEITGVVAEYNPGATGDSHTQTQIAPIPGIKDSIISNDNPIPEPTTVPISVFHRGDPNLSGQIVFSTGEKYEEGLVRLVGMTDAGTIDPVRGTWNMVDGEGNFISDYDISYYWTIGSGETPQILGDPGYSTPPQYSVIDTMIGTIWTATGVNNKRGFRIAPLFHEDVVFGVSLPTVNTHRRYPVLVSSNDTVRIQARVAYTGGGYPIASAKLITSINYGPWTELPMTIIHPGGTDSMYEAKIWDGSHFPYGEGTVVRYFIKGIDDHGYSNLYANTSATPSDTSHNKGFFTYTVIDRPYTIRDIQQTPYSTGRSLYLGANVTIRGVVTASVNEIRGTAVSNFASSAVFIQDGTAPWSGMWVVKDSANNPPLEGLLLGDSVEVSGSVQESAEMTRIFDSAVTVISHNRPLPQPITLSPGDFPSTKGVYEHAEPYEGMLVRLVHVVLPDTLPNYNDPTEFSVQGDTGDAMIVRTVDGLNSYSFLDGDTSAAKIILHKYDHIDTLIGVCYYNSHYKLVPRTDADFRGVGTHFSYPAGWNMVSMDRKAVPVDPGARVTTLFPGNTSVFNFASGYHSQTSMTPGTGYWIKFSSAKTFYHKGRFMYADTIPVVAGWNLVGAPSDSLPASSVTSYPAGNGLSEFFLYSNGYNKAAQLVPGQGYWVKCDSNGTIVMHVSGRQPMTFPKEQPQYWNSLTLTDANGAAQTLYFTYDENGAINLKHYEMPPAMTALGFDARFASGRLLETYSNTATFPINVHSTGSVTISWNIVDNGSVASLKDGKNALLATLKGTGSIKNVKITDGQFVLTAGGSSAVPLTYYLGQNYPNPFNPSTRMEVGLPEASHLKVAIYNVLGQKVRTLVDEDRSAGIQTLIWNGNADAGTQVATGIYFVRMEAGKFSQTQKIMMLK